MSGWEKLGVDRYKIPLRVLLSFPTQNHHFYIVSYFFIKMKDHVLRPRLVNTSYHIPPFDEESPSKAYKKSSLKTPKSRITKSHSQHKKGRQRSIPKRASNLQLTLPKVPYFSPLFRLKPLHKAQNRLPPFLLHQNVIGLRHIFDLFFSDDILTLMARNTNLYAIEKRKTNLEKEKSKTGGWRWKPVMIQELRCWFGVLIYMGLVREPAVSDYWRGEQDILWPHPDICDYMSQTRFKDLKRYFHVADIDAPKFTSGPTPWRLWHGKVDPLLQQLWHASQAFRLPQSNVTIDEAMMCFLGCSVDTCKMPGKPIEIGYKFHCMVDCRYVWDFWPQSRKDSYDPYHPAQ